MLVNGAQGTFKSTLFLLAAAMPVLLAQAQEPAPVTVSELNGHFTLANGLLTAEIRVNSGVLVSLKYHGLELMARGRGGANGGYWSSVGRGHPGSLSRGVLRIDPATNHGGRAEISCELHNDPRAPDAPLDADYRYALARGETWLYVYAVLKHRPGYPTYRVGEARYCLKLNPDILDYLTVDADRRRLMPSGYDWDHGTPLNLKEARRMTTGVHKGDPEYKYDYSALLSETPAYGWSSTREEVGLWLINPSMEYLGGGPTKAELTGHLDVNPGGLPTLLNMWVGSHYGGTTISVAADEAWTKVVGPFLIYCNGTPPANPVSTAAKWDSARGSLVPPVADQLQMNLWQNALARAAKATSQWPFAWVADPDYPPASARATVTGELVLHDPVTPDSTMSNIWVGLTAPDYLPATGSEFGRRPLSTNNPPASAPATNSADRGSRFREGRGGFPPYVDWQRDAKFYQFWVRADAAGRFSIAHVSPGTYTLHAIADGVLGEFALTNISVTAGVDRALGRLTWTPLRFGRTLWQIGVPDRTAREFRHGDHYWQWGLYFEYPNEFPNDVNFVVGQSNWRRDWNYVQPPRIEPRAASIVNEDHATHAAPANELWASAIVRSSTWSITFALSETPRGQATLRLAFCGTHLGCNVEAFVNGQSVGETGPLPSTSAMQRDGIRAYWVEKDLGFDAGLLTRGTNVVKLLSHAHSWSQGVLYDCVRLELGAAQAATIRPTRFNATAMSGFDPFFGSKP